MLLRSPLPIQPHLYIGDSKGRPLDGGQVFIGEPNKDPEQFPINVFFDEALTIAASQPIRTKGGYIYNNGNMVEVYASESVYSVKVLNAYGVEVFYKASMTYGFDKDLINGLSGIDDLLLISSPDNGMGVQVNGSQGGSFVYDSTKAAINDGGVIINGWVRQLQTPFITPEMFGCKGDGVADDTAAMLKFAVANYNHKVANNIYRLTQTPIFNVTHNKTILDFGQSTVVGTDFTYTAIDVEVRVICAELKIITGTYDGGNLVNHYLTAASYETGYCRDVIVDCSGVLSNFSNTRNTRSTAGIRISIDCDNVTINNPIVNDVHNINGIDSVSSSTGVTVREFRKFGIVNNPIINGVYTNSGLDADGVVLFEKKNFATTGTALAIVNNPILSQTCGRGIKSQCNLKVRNMELDLSVPSKGIISPSNWRGVDAQLGVMDIMDLSYNLASDCFTLASDACLIHGNSTNLTNGNQKVKNITVAGGSNIRYIMLLNAGQYKSVDIDDVDIVGNHPNINIFYPAGSSISNSVSISNIKGVLRDNAKLIFEKSMVGRCAHLSLKNVSTNPFIVDVSSFDTVNLDIADNTVTGTLNYASISKNSVFYYTTDNTTTGGITYTTTQAIPEWARRYCHYSKGSVSSVYKDKILTKSGTKFYQTSSATATIVP